MVVYSRDVHRSISDLPESHTFSVSYQYSNRGYRNIVLYSNPKTVIGTKEVGGIEQKCANSELPYWEVGGRIDGWTRDSHVGPGDGLANRHDSTGSDRAVRRLRWSRTALRSVSHETLGRR
ncbi:hypothetical protein BN903_180 [Halorubrum sp. AJ67]|nr:hypothetical protein BN903_180 [Halorubrum sp. AJ67]